MNLWKDTFEPFKDKMVDSFEPFKDNMVDRFEPFKDNMIDRFEPFKDKVTDTFEPFKEKVTNSKVFAPCLGRSFTVNEGFDENTIIDTDDKGELAKLDQKVRNVVVASLRRKGSERMTDDDAETILSEAFKDATSVYDDFTTTDLNTLDENNSPFTRIQQESQNALNDIVLGENRNVTNNLTTTPRQSFKDKFAQMKKKQQFRPPVDASKPRLSVDGTEAATKYEKQRKRQAFLQRATNKRIIQNPSESPLYARRVPIDP